MSRICSGRSQRGFFGCCIVAASMQEIRALSYDINFMMNSIRYIRLVSVIKKKKKLQSLRHLDYVSRRDNYESLLE